MQRLRYFVPIINLSFGEVREVELDLEDELVVELDYRNARLVVAPRDLECVWVGFGGDRQQIHYRPKHYCVIDTGTMWLDPFFESYKDDLQAFYEYREQIISSMQTNSTELNGVPHDLDTEADP